MDILLHFSLKISVFFQSLPPHKSTFGREKKKKNNKNTLCTHLNVLYLVGKCDKVGRKKQSMILSVC